MFLLIFFRTRVRFPPPPPITHCGVLCYGTRGARLQHFSTHPRASEPEVQFDNRLRWRGLATRRSGSVRRPTGSFPPPPRAARRIHTTSTRRVLHYRIAELRRGANIVRRGAEDSPREIKGRASRPIAAARVETARGRVGGQRRDTRRRAGRIDSSNCDGAIFDL